jgi:hypothetical protein
MKKECIHILFLKFYSNELLTETKKKFYINSKERERSASKIV